MSPRAGGGRIVDRLRSHLISQESRDRARSGTVLHSGRSPRTPVHPQAIDGFLYSIDLSTAHADELRDRLTAYREFGTSLGCYSSRTAVQAAAKRVVSRGDRDRNLDIRRWAGENGLPIKARGKIADAVIAKYDAARTGS
ncbi:MAG TPA: histone-like nucleoid-structuring protein Lsr2 [Glycomyces sp.]|nr:histone-like nucleoid-structuring protein Lsr2 [Glycomyces sp.]